jgi:hypothetical protein
MPGTYPVEGEKYRLFGETRSGNKFHNLKKTPLTWGVVGNQIYHHGEYVPQDFQTQEEYDNARAEKRQEAKAAGGTWNVFAAGSEIGLQRNGSVDEPLRVALRNTKLNGNKLTACDMMGQCAIYILTAAGAALVAAKLAGLAGGKKLKRNKSKRNKSKRNKSKRNKSKHNKSKKNKRRSIRRR